MAVEKIRGCGYRKVGGVYLVGDGLGYGCDRLPMAIIPCAICGEEPRFNQGISRIDPYNLWGQHSSDSDSPPCLDTNITDVVCFPPIASEIFKDGNVSTLDIGMYLQWVGKDYTAQSFMNEARDMGVSKRIPKIPNDLVIGKSWVYLAKANLVPNTSQAWLPGEVTEKRGYGPGVFYAFKPTAIEMIITESQDKDGKGGELEKQGIKAVVVPDNDPDHMNKRNRYRTPEEQGALL